MGILGSALAVVLGRGAGSLLLLYVLWRGWTNIRLDLSRFRVDLGIMWQIVQIGVPSMVQYTVRSIGRIFLLTIISPFGTLALAAWSVANQVSRVIGILAYGVGSAATTLVGQNLGAGQPDRAERSAWAATGLGVGVMGLASVVLFLAAPATVRIFNSDPEIVAMGSTGLRILVLGFVFLALGMTMGRSLSGAGSTLPPMVISLVSLWLIQLPLALVLRRVPGLSINGIWAAIVISNVTTGLASTFWFRLGRWKWKQI
jgi:putative MATE family efflux protein